MAPAPAKDREGSPSPRRKNWKKAPRKDGESTDNKSQPPAMKRWQDRYGKRSKNEGRASFTPRSQQSDDRPATEGAPFQHHKLCGLLMGLAFFGGFFMQMGLTVGPEGCSNDSVFEALGGVAFFVSMIGVPINLLFFISSLKDVDIPSGEIFSWSMAHVGVLALTLAVFNEAILQDMFCNGGPGFHITASPV